MSFIKKFFDKKSKYEQVIRVDANNLNTFPKIEALLNTGKVKFDSKGRLRYLHGAPVGDMILIKIDNDNPIYKEGGEEWFDPNSQKAKDFIWE
jgi:hypothetical protein